MVAKIKDTDAAKNALLVTYAMDMCDMHPNDLKPQPDPRINEDGWRILGYINSTDAVIPETGGPINFGERVYYGYVAESVTEPLRHIVVIRGTKGVVEWIEDAEFHHVQYKDTDARVEQGFFGIFERISYTDIAGKIYDNALDGIQEATQKGTGSITVIGHSLGSAVATYIALGLVLDKGIKGRVNACLIASPRPGDSAFAELFQKHLGGRYKLYNYALDVVPHLPTRIMGYAPLQDETTISLSEAEAKIHFDLGCNHHAVCYAAMLDYHLRDWAQLPPQDRDCTQCIKGPSL